MLRIDTQSTCQYDGHDSYSHMRSSVAATLSMRDPTIIAMSPCKQT